MNSNAGKILAIFLFILIFFILFFAGAVNVASQNKSGYGHTTKQEILPFRGAVITSDGLTLADSVDTWYLAFSGKNIVPEKQALFARMVSLYTEVPEGEILRLTRTGYREVVRADLDTKTAKGLRRLSVALDKMGVFATRYVNGRPTRYGLEVRPNPVKKRLYPYADLATPVVGFVRREDGAGVTGAERFFDETLRGKASGWIGGEKDAGGNLVYNKKLYHVPPRNGGSVLLTLDGKLQHRVEALLDAQKAAMEAQEVIAGVMEPKTGNLLVLASSNRYHPDEIRPEEVPHTRMSAIQHLFEPGSVAKPLVFAMLLESQKVQRFEILAGHGGKMKIRRKVIEDEVRKTDWMTAEDVLVYSSNVGIAQLAMRLSAYEFREGFQKLGIAENTDVDLPFEARGDLPDVSQMQDILYKATAGYGYGFRTTFLQLLKAYNTINNGGVAVRPRLASKILSGEGKVIGSFQEPKEVLSRSTAMMLRQILRKTVSKGTGRNADVPGLFVAGKTGTAHIAGEGGYTDTYHGSFFGFAEDGESSYTVGVLFIRPTVQHFGSQTAAPVFKEIVGMLAEAGRLHPETGSEVE